MGSNLIPRVEFANPLSLGIFIFIWFSHLDYLDFVPAALDLSLNLNNPYFKYPSDITPGAIVDGYIVEGPKIKPLAPGEHPVLTRNPFLPGNPWVYEHAPNVPLVERHWWFKHEDTVVEDCFLAAVVAAGLGFCIILAWQIWGK